jgi:outer membrane protein assembly factor BamE (lipoprotein component of BamABCDE complex)
MLIFFTLSSLFLNACSLQEKNGYFFESESYTILPNVQKKADLINILGEPTVEIGNSFYYISLHKNRIAFLKPYITKSRVLVLRFNKDGLLTESQEFIKHGKLQYEKLPNIKLEPIKF